MVQKDAPLWIKGIDFIRKTLVEAAGIEPAFNIDISHSTVLSITKAKRSSF